MCCVTKFVSHETIVSKKKRIQAFKFVCVCVCERERERERERENTAPTERGGTNIPYKCLVDLCRRRDRKDIKERKR